MSQSADVYHIRGASHHGSECHVLCASHEWGECHTP
jgi:hypothetical protein